MRPWLGCSLALVLGCGGPQLLPTTLFHARLAAAAAPSDDDWARLGRARDPRASHLIASTPIGDAEWLLWIGASGEHGGLVRARQTDFGLEAQSFGEHEGPAVRPSVRTLVVAGTRFVVVESSISSGSTDRDAWLHAEHGSEIVPLSLDGAPARVRVRAERRRALEHGWTRVATLTATFEATEAGLVVHEHASVREIADDRPQLPPRSTYEVERARVLRRTSAVLTANGPSLFDEQG